MVSETVAHVVRRATAQLEEIARYYDSVCINSAPPLDNLLRFLAHREQDTAAALSHWSIEDHCAADVWIRQADCFPYSRITSERAVTPVRAELLALAEETDRQLRSLVERLQTYVAAERPSEMLQSISNLINMREGRLDAVVRELDHGY